MGLRRNLVLRWLHLPARKHPQPFPQSLLLRLKFLRLERHRNGLASGKHPSLLLLPLTRRSHLLLNPPRLNRHRLSRDRLNRPNNL